MRRLWATAVSVTLLLALAAVPAGAQDIADLPRLGYDVQPDRGHPNEDVHSTVDTDDLSDHCWEFESIPNIDYISGEVTAQQFVSSFSMDLLSYIDPITATNLLTIVQNQAGTGDELIQAWESIHGPVPSGTPIVDFLLDAQTMTPPPGVPDDTQGQDFMASVAGIFLGATSFLGLGQLVPPTYAAVHITSFVDPVTQELLGDTGTFDATTGEGEMLVPELDPDLYAVVAACAFFPPPDQFPAAYMDGIVAAWDASVACAEEGGEDCFPVGTSAQANAEWAAEVGFPALFGAMFAPKAVGIDFYCILDTDGFCAVPPEPVGLIDEDVIDSMNGDDADGIGPEADAELRPADVIDGVAPAFTG